MSFQFRTDSAAAWSAADPVLGAGEIGLEYDSGRVKVGDGVTRWRSLAYVISAPAQVVSEEKAHGSQTELRSFSPADVRDMVVTFAPPPAVTSVAGKTGAVSLTRADVGLEAVTNQAQLRADFGYTAKSVPGTGDKLIIKDAADGQPRIVDISELPTAPRVNASEKSVGTSTTVRGFAPVDVRDMVVTFAPPPPVTSVAGKSGAVLLSKADVGLSAVTNDAQLRADLAYASKPAAAAGDKMVIKDVTDGSPKLMDLGALPLRPTAISASEKAAGTTTSLRSFAPSDVRDMVVTFSPPPPVTSVAGKTGAVSLTKADVGLAAVTNDAQLRADFGYSSKVTPVPGDKLVIKDGSDGQPKTVDWNQLPTQPTQVNSDEKIESTLTAVRSFSPADVRDIVETFAPMPPVVSDEEKIEVSLTSIRAFSPKDIADMIKALARPSSIDGGTANTVFPSGTIL